MGIVQLRKNRILKLVGGLLFVVLVVVFLNGGSKNGGARDDLDSAPARKPRSPPKFLHGQPGNFEPKSQPPKEGPGEGGKGYVVPSSQQNEAHQSINEYGINMIVSDAIAMNRQIPDTRLEECKYWDYPEDLPKASVVIVFHNEGWSTLLRTVHTVIDRSPPQFLEEVLMVDDFSDKANLKRPLEDYIRRFKGKVRLVRNKEREGLIRSRTNGAMEARGEVVLFLDAHCEVGPNWLPPLLAPIYVDRTTMTVPIIDGIDHDDFTYRPVYSGSTHFRGIFEWGMLYKESELPSREMKKRQQDSEPYAAPTHAGGLFAIDRKYFLEIGAYDPGLLVWGGENFELSFKIWQCGGRIVWVPCSRVGHVYRGFMPYTFGKLAEKKKGPLITINYKRVIEVWFDDEFKEYFYTREPMARFLDAGNLTEQLDLKRRLHCKSFKWFMENVAYDVPDKYPYLPPNKHWGELRNTASGDCLDTMGHGAPALMGISYCHGFGNNQLMRFNTEGQLMIGERCVIADSQGVKLVVCRLGTVDGPWEYDEQTHTMYHKTLKKCMSVHAVTKKLSMLPCSEGDNYFKWTFKALEPKW